MALQEDPYFGFNTTQAKSLEKLVDSLELDAASVATTTEAGVVKKAATVAAAAVPFADLTAAANKVNEILTSLKAAGIMA